MYALKIQKPFTVHLKVKVLVYRRKFLNLVGLSTPLHFLHSVRRV